MGVAVRDHGELWCGPWECYDASPTSLTQVFESRTFGYRLERALKLSGPRLRADYRLSASASGPRLWAWHPQFAARPDTRLILEGDLDHVLDTSIATAVTSVPWRGHLDLAHDCVDGGDRMLYAPPEVRVSGATLVDPGGSSLSLRWDAQAIPYVGVWLDRGRYSNGGAIAVEPTTGFFDDVARAWAAGMVSVFDEGDSLAWWIEMEVS